MYPSSDVVTMAEQGPDGRDEDPQSPDGVGQSPMAGIPQDSESPPTEPEPEGGGDADGFEPSDHEAPFGDFEETSDRVMFIGEIGVYIGYVAVALAVLGIALAAFSIQPLARMTLVVSFVLVTVALLIGFFFQMATGGFPIG